MQTATFLRLVFEVFAEEVRAYAALALGCAAAVAILFAIRTALLVKMPKNIQHVSVL